MRRFALWATLLVVLLVGFTLVLLHSLRTVGGAVERIREEQRRAESRIRALDVSIPGPDAVAALPPDRLPAYLRVRFAVATVFGARLQESASDDRFHVLGTRVRLLEALADGLEREKMRPREYREIARRLHALIAADSRLSDAWRRELRNAANPEGLPLPEPAAGVSEGERGLLRDCRTAIEGSMAGEWATPLLDRALDLAR
jgi:hypothetical protein